MRTVTSHVTIDRPPDAVWRILADLTAMGQYMPGIATVRLTSTSPNGIGAARHCVFDDGVELEERVTHWEEGTGYTLETTRFVKVPMRANTITFALRPDAGGTIVSQTMQYSMKGGPVAPLMEVMAKPRMMEALNGALGGLKAYAEAQA